MKKIKIISKTDGKIFLTNKTMEFFKYKATEVWITDTEIFIKLNTGEISSLPITNFPLLIKGTFNQRKNVEIINGYALYWPELDEDISVAGFFENVLV